MSTAQAVAAAFTEEDDVDDTFVVATASTKSARIKGTWQMYWGGQTFNFVDKQRFTIPSDLFDYLKSRDCIYDTL